MLFQMVFKVACDDIVQVYAVAACHVVSVAWIDEEVGVGVGIDAGAHEGEGVLGHTDRVVSAVDDEEAAFEVLAIIAYNQPITKPYIEQIRGVDCSGVVNTLCQRGRIEEKGRLDVPGRPVLYGTTDDFLRCFSLSALSELEELPNVDKQLLMSDIDSGQLSLFDGDSDDDEKEED